MKIYSAPLSPAILFLHHDTNAVLRVRLIIATVKQRVGDREFNRVPIWKHPFHLGANMVPFPFAHGHYGQSKATEENDTRFDGRPMKGVSPTAGTGPLCVHTQLYIPSAARTQDAGPWFLSSVWSGIGLSP